MFFISGRRDYSDYSGEHNFSFHSKIVVTIFSFKKIICSYGLGSHSLTRCPTENPPNPLMAFLILIYTNKKHIPKGMCFLLAEDGTSYSLAFNVSSVWLLNKLCLFRAKAFALSSLALEPDKASPCGSRPAFTLKKNSGRRDSNPRRQPWEGCILPLNYFRMFFFIIQQKTFFVIFYPKLVYLSPCR